MQFMTWIIEELANVSDFFYDAYSEVKDWIFPFYYLKYPLLGLYTTFHWLSESFYDFYQWLDWAADRIDEILSWSNIRSLIGSWLYRIEDAVDWFLSWTYWVRQEISDWWTGILPYILTYVDNAVEGFTDLIEAWDTFWTITFPTWTTELLRVGSELSAFFAFTLPTLVSFTWLTTWWNSKLTEIDTLINSWFLTFTPFWEGWLDWKGQVTEFFSDPYQWIYDRLDEFFERFW